MSVAGLRYSPGTSHGPPLETKSGSYIYAGEPAGYHDWSFRTQLRIRLSKEKAKEKKKEKKEKAESASGGSSPARGSRMPASPSSAGGARATRRAADEAVPTEREENPPTEGEEDDHPSFHGEAAPDTPGDRDDDDGEVDMTETVHRVLEGLRGDAFLLARDIGLERLCKPDGLDHLLERVRQMVFPLAAQEAKELFRQGQLVSGPLSRQPGESMLSLVSRRRRWWAMLTELDPGILLSNTLRADLLLETSGLSRNEQLMIKTAAREQTFDEYARVLTEQHAVVHMKEGRTLAPSRGPFVPSKGKGYKSKSKPYRPPNKGKGTWPRSYGYWATEPGWEGEENDAYDDDGWGESYALQAWSEDPDSDWHSYPQAEANDHAFWTEEEEITVSDEDTAIALNAMAELEGADPESAAEAVQLQLAAHAAMAKGKGKGQGKPKGKGKFRVVKSHLTVEDRKHKLAEIKAKSRCLRCGATAHWAGDPACKMRTTPNSHSGATKPSGQAYLACLSDSSDEDEDACLDLRATAPKDPTGYMGYRTQAPRRNPAQMVDVLPPGGEQVFGFGQHRGHTFHEVLFRYPSYYVWGSTQRGPSKGLADFLDWVNAHYTVDRESLEVLPREVPLEMAPRGPRVIPASSAHQTAARKPPNPPLPEKCRRCTDFLPM